MNKVFLNGYLAQDPKGRVTPKGLDQSNITVAVDDSKNSNETYFIPCVIWGNSAKYVNANLTKGSFVAIDGRLSKRKYVMQNGQTSYVTEVLVDNIRAFSLKKNNSENVLNQITQPQVNNDNPQIQNQIPKNDYSDVVVEIDNIINSHNASSNSINEEIDNEDTSDFDEFNELDWEKEFN